MKEWLEKNGSEALQRAHEEGYPVARGVSDWVLTRLTEALTMEIYTEWDDVRTRTSPHAESFAKRDIVKTVCDSIDAPPGWAIQVSKISRFEISEDDCFTGVLVEMFDENRKNVRRVAVNFEG